MLSGTVRESGTEKVLPGARITVSGGSIAGALATSDMNGRFSFPSLQTGTIAVEATKDGYLTPLNATVGRIVLTAFRVFGGWGIPAHLAIIGRR